MIPVTHYLILAAVLFGLSLVGVMLNRKNIILLLICVELMLLAINTNFIAAAEAAIGLAIVMLLYRNRGNIDVDKMNYLKG